MIRLSKFGVAVLTLTMVVILCFLIPLFVGLETMISNEEGAEITSETLVLASHRDKPTKTPTPTFTPTPTPKPDFVRSYEIEYYEDIKLSEKIEYCSMAEDLSSFLDSSVYGNPEEVEVEIERLEEIVDLYSEDIAEWNEKVEEYPIACEIWLYLTEEMNLEEIQAAAIIGNMMVEAGGYSLHIDPYAYDAGFYGVCQWSTSYHYRANGLDLQGQLNYLNETLEDEFRYGSASYSQFINATNVRDASVYFAKGYERCADPYGRQSTAERAYSYFVE